MSQLKQSCLQILEVEKYLDDEIDHRLEVIQGLVQDMQEFEVDETDGIEQQLNLIRTFRRAIEGCQELRNYYEELQK